MAAPREYRTWRTAARALETRPDLISILVDTRLEFDVRVPFARFVNALERHPRIERLTLWNCFFDPLNDDEVGRLFGRVLPTHSTLNIFTFYHCYFGLRIRHIESFALALSRRTVPVRRLHFSQSKLNSQVVVAIATMLASGAPSVQELNIMRCEVDTAGCKLICDSVGRNSHLKELNLSGTMTVNADTVEQALSPSSSLRELLISANWTMEGVQSVVEQLKTNTVLTTLTLDHLGGGPIDHARIFDMFEDLLSSYNFTLTALGGSLGLINGYDERIRPLLQHNVTVRNAHTNLERNNYRVEEIALLPFFIGRVSSHPNLTLNFFRGQNLPAQLLDHRQPAQILPRVDSDDIVDADA